MATLHLVMEIEDGQDQVRQISILTSYSPHERPCATLTLNYIRHPIVEINLVGDANLKELGR